MASTAHTALDLDAWSDTPLGDPEAWPEALRTAAQICLAYPTTCCVLWGEQSRFFYNASMAASIGSRHPSAMGQPLYDVAPYLWRTVGPLIHEVISTGRPFNATRFPIQVDVGDGVMQYFVDFSLVPVRDGDRVAGVFAPVGNNTVTHLDGQHHAAVAAVASVPGGQSRTDVAVQIARHLTEPDDIRYAVLFLRDDASGELERVATAGAALRPAATRAALEVAVSHGLWPLEQVLASRGGPERIDGAARGSRVSRPLWQDAWLIALPEPVQGVLVLGVDERFANRTRPEDRIRRLAAAAGERLGR